MFIVNDESLKASADPIQVKTLQFDLNCMNLPNAFLEVEMPDGSRAVINGVELDPNSDPAKPTLLLSFELKEAQVAREEQERASAEEDLGDLLDSLST